MRSTIRTRKKGFFITFEGPECAGKTTQIALLEDYFRRQNQGCIVTREPGGTIMGEELRRIVKHHMEPQPVGDKAELLLFAASRAQHVQEVIRPALQMGLIVICDRFCDSTVAYQGYARGLEIAFIKTLNNFATSGCTPHLTFLLDLPVGESLRRGTTRQETLFVEDRIESENENFHEKVRSGFLKISEAEPERVKVIPAVQPPETIHQEIKKLTVHALA